MTKSIRATTIAALIALTAIATGALIAADLDGHIQHSPTTQTNGLHLYPGFAAAL